jgi:hypothetical protein
MSADKEINIPEILMDRPRVQKALRDAVQRAIHFHKLMGRPIVVWKDGKVVEIPADQIQVQDKSNGEPPIK